MHVVFQRTGWMIIRHKKPTLSSLLHHITDTFRGVVPNVIRLIFVKIHLVSVLRCGTAGTVIISVPTNLLQIVRL